MKKNEYTTSVNDLGKIDKNYTYTLPTKPSSVTPKISSETRSEAKKDNTKIIKIILGITVFFVFMAISYFLEEGKLGLNEETIDIITSVPIFIIMLLFFKLRNKKGEKKITKQRKSNQVAPIVMIFPILIFILFLFVFFVIRLVMFESR